MKTMLKSTIEKGIAFLCSQQHSNGTWQDFHLPTGISDSWVTAYIGLHLYWVCIEYNSSPRENNLARAAHWLASHSLKNGGWSYNAHCAADSDTTAHTILFLQKLGEPVSPKSYDFLLSFQNQDGGFGTYHYFIEGDTWGQSHPDVTPVAAIALAEHLKNYPVKLKNLLAYIRLNQNQNGLWESFWWKTPLYSTTRNLDSVQELGIDYDQQSLKRSLLNLNGRIPFDMALALYCRLRLSLWSDLLPRVKVLCKSQLPDGSWPSFPGLRLTSRRCRKPWRVSTSGRLYSDQNRLFTSATVLRSLSLYYALYFDYTSLPSIPALERPGPVHHRKTLYTYMSVL